MDSLEIAEATLIAMAKVTAATAFKCPDLCELLLSFDENTPELYAEAVCLAQQMVAEATGLVGLPEVYENHR